MEFAAQREGKKIGGRRMKYFLNENERNASGSTCYHEFCRGKWDENTMVFWHKDSMNIHDDWMFTLGLEDLISNVIDNYQLYGETEINKEQWRDICTSAEKIGGDLLEAIKEIKPWVEDNFLQNEVFTILGI